MFKTQGNKDNAKEYNKEKAEEVRAFWLIKTKTLRKC